MLIRICRSIIALLPTKVATRLTIALADRTSPAFVSPVEAGALASGFPFRFGKQGYGLAYSWGSGPLVVLVHGWGGRAAQMAPLAQQIAQYGFRAIALEVSGHGESAIRNTRWSYFLDDIKALFEHLQEPVYALLGHSAGALAMMASRRLRGTEAEKYICICAPSHPYPPVQVVVRKLNPPGEVVERFMSYISDQFEQSWEELVSGSSYANISGEIMLFYDDEDRLVDLGNGERIRCWCPEAEFVKSSGYGHNRVLGSHELTASVVGFLNRRTASAGVSIHTEELLSVR
jgi:hypothetical protein